ncbi:hypothetical protein AVEN_182258-1 [Araneus ventricosus]|uniref:Uncharacterized protein n=1 Tax=Araneus ventricosus TaxID=182803 RepID=A0A4Y2DHX8_ARAVE|nr:hypothetical protein AVEN_182258-1 [Araneus ventricosus]
MIELLFIYAQYLFGESQCVLQLFEAHGDYKDNAQALRTNARINVPSNAHPHPLNWRKMFPLTYFVHESNSFQELRGGEARLFFLELCKFCANESTEKYKCLHEVTYIWTVGYRRNAFLLYTPFTIGKELK